MIPLALVLAACSSPKHAPILFGQGATIGLKVSAGSAANPIPSIVFGYDAIEVASVPTLDRDGVTMGGVIPLSADAGGSVAKDAYSVFGGFGTDIDTDASSGVGAGITTNRFFSVGQAAAKLADGEACRLSRGTVSHCTGSGASAFGGISG